MRAADHGLQTQHHLRRGDDRVHAQPRRGAVCLAAEHGDLQLVAAGHGRAGAIAEHARGQARGHVQAEDGARRGLVQRAFGDHHLRAAVFAFGRHLLGGLEDELHAAAQLRTQPGQDLRHAHQDGDVAVVPAGVHDADLFAVPLAARLAGKGQVHFLAHRQAVHVGAQRHHRAGQRPLEQAHHAGVGHARAHLVQAQRAQVIGDHAGGAELAVAQFGVLMQIAPPGDDGGFDARGRLVDGGGKRNCASRWTGASGFLQ